MNTCTLPRPSRPVRLNWKSRAFVPEAVDQDVDALLFHCLNQFEALNNACTYTGTQELRDRLRAALGLPLEATEAVPDEDDTLLDNVPFDSAQMDAYCREECARLNL